MAELNVLDQTGPSSPLLPVILSGDGLPTSPPRQINTPQASLCDIQLQVTHPNFEEICSFHSGLQSERRCIVKYIYKKKKTQLISTILAYKSGILVDVQNMAWTGRCGSGQLGRRGAAYRAG